MKKKKKKRVAMKKLDLGRIRETNDEFLLSYLVYNSVYNISGMGDESFTYYLCIYANILIYV